jgi:hypothetical protein
MKRTVAIVITILSVIIAAVNWGDVVSYGWIVAAAGWIDKCFKE